MRVVFIRQSKKIKCIVLVLVLVIIFLFLIRNINYTAGFVKKSSLLFSYVVVHIDLKGSPPKLSYLESLLPKLKKWGVNGILLEYEDMFPYEGKLANLSATNCYNKNDLNSFIVKSVRLGIEVIPLIQTFSHMEHVLKLQEFRHLREEDTYPDSICPSNAESRKLIKEMLTQVIKFHISIVPLNYIHIGCNEAYSINQCEKCRLKNVTDTDLFAAHVLLVNDIIKKLSPHTSILMWNDMLREITKLQLFEYIASIEPVLWDFGPKLSVSNATLHNYHKSYKNIWIASAFKGAEKQSISIPSLKNRYINHYNWLKLILNSKFVRQTKVHKFKGIILTGWSRNSHMEPLCELLPVAMPSLILNLLLIQRMRKGIVCADSQLDFNSFFLKYLKSEFEINVPCKNLQDASSLDRAGCWFESSSLYYALKQYIIIYSVIRKNYSNARYIYSTLEYYSKINYINMMSVQSSLQWCEDTLKKLSDFESDIKQFMVSYYEKDVINEYVSSKTFEIKKILTHTIQIFERYKNIRSWERRPVQRTISKG